MSSNSDKSEDLREKNSRYLALQRRKNELRSQISSLENIKSNYISFRSALNVLEKKLLELNIKLNVAADGLLTGLIVDGIPMGESYARENAKLACDYASDLASNYVNIDNKIALITTQLNQKYSELASLR